MASNFMNKYGAMSENINPTGKERSHSQPKTVTAMMVSSNKLQERAETAEAQVQQLKEQLANAKATGGALDLALESLVIVPGRQRKLTSEQYAELKENLTQHPLITPISVRVLPDGKYEVVSGHNRVQVYQELERATIPAWLADEDQAKTEELAFYANLLHPDLPAFEKYIGLKKIILNNPDLNTHELLAQRTGLSRSTVTELLSFDNLPPEALDALAAKPNALGPKTAAKLAALAQKGNKDQVAQAIRIAVGNSIDQQEILRIASAKPKTSVTPAKPVAQTFKAGRRNYCSVLANKTTLRLDFQSEDERVELQEKIEALVAEYAAKKK